MSGFVTAKIGIPLRGASGGGGTGGAAGTRLSGLSESRPTSYAALGQRDGQRRVEPEVTVTERTMPAGRPAKVMDFSGEARTRSASP